MIFFDIQYYIKAVLKKEDIMNIKKFNVAKTEGVPAPLPEITPDTTTIEIGKHALEKPPRKFKRINKGLVLFCAVCYCFSAILFHVDLPQSAEKALWALAKQITKPIEQEVQNTLPAPHEKISLSFFPAACDSDISDLLPSYHQEPLRNLLLLSNETSYNVDVAELLKQDFPIGALNERLSETDSVSVFAQNDPTVLIIHTHGTEGYSDCRENDYRTKDKEKNVVAQGALLAKRLSEYGISTLHCTEMFDESSYIKAYSNSRYAVSEYLRAYPSIKYVIDLHRDAVPSKDGDGYVRLTTTIDGKPCALLMLVVGTDEAGAEHPEWRKNLRTALEIQKDASTDNESLMRSINLRRASFNQQLCQGYFILEAGSCENTSQEVSNSIELFAKSFANTVK